MNETFLNESLLNSTIFEHAPRLTNVGYIKAIVLASMAGISSLANVATIWAAENNRKKNKGVAAIHTLIFHLAIADLLVTIFCIAGEAIWTYTVAWLWGNITCKLFKFLQMFSLYLSTFVMVLIGFDRFLAIRYPMKSFNTVERCSGFILIIWILSSIFSIPQFIIFRVARGPFIEDFMQCVTHGFYTAAWQEQLYTTLTFVLLFIIPLIALIITYVSTVITISHNATKFRTKLTHYDYFSQEIRNANRTRLMRRAKNKSLRISIVIITAFVFWWTPYYTMMIIFVFIDPDDLLGKQMQETIFFFGMSNSLVNPIIYGAFHLWPQKKTRKNVASGRHMTMQQRNSTAHSSYVPSVRSSNNQLLCTQRKSMNRSVHHGTNRIDETTFISVIDASINNTESVETPEKINLQYKTDFTIHEIKKILIN